MAKIKLGAIVTEIRGKLGGHVFSKNRGGAYMRTKTTPVNPQSLAQSRVRSIFSVIASAWSSLTDTQRTSYRSKVKQFVSTDIFGDIRVPSGKALHHQLNQNLLLTGQPAQTKCPNAQEVTSANIVNAEYSVGLGSLYITNTGSTVGSKVIAFGTPPLSAGTKFVKNSLRMLGVLDGQDMGVFDATLLYSDKFGLLALGDNVSIALKVVNSNGQASPLQTVKVNVIA